MFLVVHKNKHESWLKEEVTYKLYENYVDAVDYARNNIESYMHKRQNNTWYYKDNGYEGSISIIKIIPE